MLAIQIVFFSIYLGLFLILCCLFYITSSSFPQNAMKSWYSYDIYILFWSRLLMQRVWWRKGGGCPSHNVVLSRKQLFSKTEKSRSNNNKLHWINASLKIQIGTNALGIYYRDGICLTGVKLVDCFPSYFLLLIIEYYFCCVPFLPAFN